MNESYELIEKYLDSILEVNKLINLTRITDLYQARVLHVEDSLSALEDINAAPEGLYGDLGSGGGFPGVPLGIATGRQTVLIDSVGKKMKAVENVLIKLSLSPQISTHIGRIEDYSQEKKNQFSVLTARALTQLPSLIELASPLLAIGGRLICYKAQIDEDEIARAVSIENKVGMKLLYRRNFILSDNETYREILVFEKTKKPKMVLPRRVGLAQKNPLA